MDEELIHKIEGFASKILRSFFCDSDVEFLISTFAPEIVWIGGGEMMRAEGKEAVAAAFRKGKGDLASCDMDKERYVTMELCDGLYLCEGDSWIETKPELKMYMHVHQRVTFIFRRKGDSFETVHIHNSVDYSGVKEDELFPAEKAKGDYEKLMSKLNIKEKEIDRQSRFLQKLYDTLPCGILQFSVKEPYEITSLNRTVWEFYGFASEEDYRRNVESPVQFVLKRDKDEILNIIKSLQINGPSVNYTREGMRPDGSTFWISAIMQRVMDVDGEEVIQAIFTDITEMTKMQRAQEQDRMIENHFLRAATCIAYPLIMSINLTQNTYDCFIEGQQGYINDRAGSYDQLMADFVELTNQSFREEYRELFNRENLLRSFSGGKKEIYMELQVLSPAGTEHWISVHVIYVDNPLNEDMLAIVLVKVLDEQRAEKLKQERLLRDALAAARAASDAKSDFLSRMSHDIRTPMNAIIGMCTIGQLHLKDPLRVMDCLKKIEGASQYLLSLINDILDMSRIENGKMVMIWEEFDFGEFFENIVSIIHPQAEEKEIALEVYHKEPIQRYYLGDSLRMKQILMNLLSNSLKFTKVGGKIWIEVYEEQRTQQNAIMVFIVRDTGIGMSDEFMERIYQPFEQESEDSARNNVGSGLGLSIVYSLVQLMGGSIEVRSEKDKGTEFKVMIPLGLAAHSQEEYASSISSILGGTRVLVVDALFRSAIEGDLPQTELNHSSGEKEALLKEPNFNGQVVLLVEDNEMNREIAKALLEFNHLIVDTASDGAEAVERFRHTPEGYYYAILMDIRMPVMDGLEAAKTIRALPRKDAETVPILAMTANAFDEDKRKAYAAGVDGYLAKPLDVQDMLDKLLKYL